MIPSHAAFTTGLGYIHVEQYRTDNEINPLPLGLSVVPMIAYRSERLRIFGPNINYSLLRGAIGFDLKLNVSGDRYKAYEIEERSTSIDAGVSLRLLFLSLTYSSDIGRTYNGNSYSLGIAHRFMLGDSIMIIPRVAREYLNKSYTRYYYSVSLDETGEFPLYSLEEATNEIYTIIINLKLSERNSISLNYTHKVFDDDIYASPTIELKRFNRSAVFWNYQL